MRAYSDLILWSWSKSEYSENRFSFPPPPNPTELCEFVNFWKLVAHPSRLKLGRITHLDMTLRILRSRRCYVVTLLRCYVVTLSRCHVVTQNFRPWGDCCLRFTHYFFIYLSTNAYYILYIYTCNWYVFYQLDKDKNKDKIEVKVSDLHS